MSAAQPDLFGNLPTPAPAAVVDVPKLSADALRTRRQREDIAAGRHPLTGGTLNTQAPNDAANAQAVGLRCGSCVHRVLSNHHGKSWPKCNAFGAAYLTHGAATDVRGWWPACGRHEPKGGAA